MRGVISMAIGKIKWFNDMLGFGVIAPNDGKEDSFATFRWNDLNGLKSFKLGQQVSYEVTHGTKGKQATNIQIHANY